MNVRILLKPHIGMSRSWMLRKRRSQCSSRGQLQPLWCFWSREVAKAPSWIWGPFHKMLGDWNTEPVSFKQKEGEQPYHVRPFPTPDPQRNLKNGNWETLWVRCTEVAVNGLPIHS
jgi:hypothetical protein